MATSFPRSALRHRPIGSDVQEFVVLSPRTARATRGKSHQEPHTTGGPPSGARRRNWREKHPGVLISMGMIATLVVLWAGQGVVAWGQVLLDDWQFGMPRTSQVDHYVGHEQTHTPTHFTAMNLNGQVYVLEIPGGNPKATHLLIGPNLVGAGAALAPVTLAFLGDARHPDLLLSVGNIQERFRNTGAGYVPAE